MTKSAQDLHFSVNFQRSMNPAMRDAVQDFDPFAGGRYLRAFDHIDAIDQCSHHILVYLGSRMPYDQGTFVGIEVWPSIATISHCTKMDSSTVRRKIHKLAEMGYIVAKRNKRMNNAGKWEQGSNTYALTEKAFLQYGITAHQKTLANSDISGAARASLERKIEILKGQLANHPRSSDELANVESQDDASPSTLVQDPGDPFVEYDEIADINETVVERLPGTASSSDSRSGVAARDAQPETISAHSVIRPNSRSAREVSGSQPVAFSLSASGPLAQGAGSVGLVPGGGSASAGGALAEWQTNSPFKSPLNSTVKSSSRLHARTHDGLDHQLIVEEEVDVGRFNDAIADLSRQYAAYFGTNPSKGDLDRFCSHFLDICPNTLGADEKLMAKVYADMKWVYERPHLHRAVRSINFVWHMAKMMEKDVAYVRRISYFIRCMVSEGKSIGDTLHSCAKAMNIDFKRFSAWAKEHMDLDP